MTHKYTCKECSHKWLKFVKVGHKTKCPKCNSGKLGRVATPKLSFLQTTDSFLREELGENI
mgnify:CR=1 FL=1